MDSVYDDEIANADLIFEQKEQAAEPILDERLCAEADG